MNKSIKNTGIELTAQKMNVVSPRTKISGLSYLVLFLFFEAGMYGFFYSFVSAFPIEYKDGVLFWGILILGIALWCIYYSGRLLLFLSLGLAIGGAVFGYLNLEVLKNQVYLLINVLRSAVNNYFLMDLEPCAVNKELGKDMTELLLLSVVIIGIVLFWGLVVRVNKALAVMVTIWPAIGAMLVGILPSFWSLSLLTICYMGLFSIGKIEFRYKRKLFGVGKYYKNGITGASALIMGLVTALLFTAAALLVTPSQDYILTSTRQLRTDIQNNGLMEEIRDVLPKLRLSTSGAGKIDSGELGGSIYFTGEEALDVVLYKKPAETLYLKGFEGREYNGKRWKKDSDDDFFEGISDGNESTEDRRARFLEAPYLLAQKLERAVGYSELSNQAVVERKAASSDKEYKPYISAKTAGGEQDAAAFSFYTREKYADLISQISDIDLYSIDNAQDSYRTYVYDNYLDYPVEQLPRLKALCDANPIEWGYTRLGDYNEEAARRISDSADSSFMRFNQVREFVVEQVTNGAIYNLQVKNTPVDQDFVEYFLFESREGYCVHFATTAVLMFRMYGIPARYATGYVADVSEFKKNTEGNYEAHIKDEKAHAWAEVYLDGEGWIPVETTPGYSSGGTAAETMSEETESIKVTQKDETQTNSEKKKENISSSESMSSEGNKISGLDSKAGRAAILIALAALLTGAAVTIIYLRRIWILRKRREADIKEIFVSMYDLFILGGIPKKYDGWENCYPDVVVQKFNGIPKKEFAVVMGLVMCAYYGNEPSTPEDTRRVKQMYNLACQQVYEKLNLAERLEFKYIRVFR